ncbi:MAG: hypothetical protein CM1200mP35_01950 [Chloroflexota bacterium]|nr:MAG: hypothetical protein CM1200mP35_01950 [Chloroflexota bacterium]
MDSRFLSYSPFWWTGSLGNRSSAIHVGASGLVFGYFGYFGFPVVGMIARLARVFISIAVIIFYGGMLFGLSDQRFYFWEAHLSGLIAGILAARLMRQGKV